MRKTATYSPEVRERAVRMVLEHLNDYPSEWAAIETIAPEIGCAAQTLHGSTHQHPIRSKQSRPFTITGWLYSFWRRVLYSEMSPESTQPCEAGPSWDSTGMTVFWNVRLLQLSLAAFTQAFFILFLIRRRFAL